MEKQSIQAIKQMFLQNQIDEVTLVSLRSDERKGVQKLVTQYEKQLAKERALAELYEEKKQFEQQFRSNEDDLIAGVDEAGRGPLAGPVVAAAVILPKDFNLTGLTDSKQLTEQERNTYFDVIKEQAISYHISIIDNARIDRLNILEATKTAMIESLTGLQPAPDVGLIDAVKLPALPFPTKDIIKGDDKSISIAAASVLAKVTRDRIMEEVALEFPQYHFDQHKGYGTKQHLEALSLHGPCPYHRKSFGPVRDCMSK